MPWSNRSSSHLPPQQQGQQQIQQHVQSTTSAPRTSQSTTVNADGSITTAATTTTSSSYATGWPTQQQAVQAPQVRYQQQQPAETGHRGQKQQVSRSQRAQNQMQPAPIPKPQLNYDHLKTKAPRPQLTAPTPAKSATTTTTTKNMQVQAAGGTAQQQAEQRGEGHAFERRVQAMIWSLGSCPAGFEWHKTEHGYLCGGGEHGVSHSQIDLWANNRHHLPTVVFTNVFDLLDVNPLTCLPACLPWCPPRVQEVGMVLPMHLAHEECISVMIDIGYGLPIEAQCRHMKVAGMPTRPTGAATTAWKYGLPPFHRGYDF
ncbi:hypothetical protein LTR62_004814 [Meristemomyces frigidus]|uniref:Uncharacterized protein n=1 Tax=Meristemomyces frigidus TaxID=1508187 RepID=A0AAN7TH73_9PEZI|nr:hypothetical protein LTR62_004814 [Meristemomyces frigidus]